MSIYNDKLFNALLALCHIAIEKTIKQRNEGKLIAIPYQYLPVLNIDYSMEFYNYDWSKLQYFDFYEWKSEDFASFLENELGNLPEFEEAAQQVAVEFNVPEDAIKKIGLNTLLRLIMKESPNDEITPDNITEYIKLFIESYESLRSHKPLVWNIHLWISNIFIESDEIELEEGVFLRRPTKEQLVEVKPRPSHESELEKITGRSLAAGAILSFSVLAGKKPVLGLYPEKIQQEIEEWLNLFRLLKPTDLTVVYQIVHPVSIFEHSISENKEPPQDKFWLGKVDHKETSSYKLYLKATEVEILQTFIKNVKPALKEISYRNYLSGSPHDLAFHRYNDSLLKTEVNAYKILSAMTSLEALFSDGSTEITYKIRLRVSKLLSIYGFNPLEVSEKVKTGYNLRSKLVHGAKPMEKETNLLEFARNNTHEIINYNRICLLIALQLKKSIDKQTLIKLIDNSLIDINGDVELKKLIAERVKIPIVNPFLSPQKTNDTIEK